MKIKRLSSLMLLTALAWLVPKTATAAEYTFSTLTNNWTYSFSGTVPSTDARQPALSQNDGQLYVLSNSAKYSNLVGSYRITSSGVTIVNTGMTSGGLANAFDDSNNYVFHAAGSTASETDPQKVGTTAHYFIAKTYAPNLTSAINVFNNTKTLNVTSYADWGPTFFLDATGNVQGGTGYIWLAPKQGGSTIYVVTTSSGSPNGLITIDTGSKVAGGNDNYIQVYDSSNKADVKLLMFLRGTGMYDVSVNLNTKTLNSCTLIPDGTGQANSNSLGAHIFMLRGHKFLVRNTRSQGSTSTEKNTCPEFEVLDITNLSNPISIDIKNPFSGKTSTQTTIGSWVQTRKISEDQVEIYTYTPGVGASCWTMTATEVVKTGAAVTGLGYSREYDKAGGYQTNTLTWTAPTGMTNTTLLSYKIYDGSTLIGTADASATSYVDSRQVTSAVTYKVVPLFDGIAETDTYSASIAVPVVDKQGAPVTNLKGAIAWDAETSTQTNTLTWTAPDEAAFVNTTLAGYKIYTGDISNGNYVEVDAALTSYNFGSVTAKTTYTVVPLFSGMEEKTSLGASVTIAKVSPVIPVINHVATFEGYNNVQVYWVAPSTAQRANYYEVWRDGIKISNRKIVAYCHIETEVVEGDHYYEIKGVYTVDGTIDGEVAVVMTSAPWNFSVTARNMTYTNYGLEEVYNYYIPQEGETATADMINNTLCPQFYDISSYRQGAYHNGYWYIIERASKGVYGGSDGIYPQYNVESTNGSVSRVLKVSADDPRNNWSVAISGLELSSSVGIAIDDAGNIFVRKKNIEAVLATRPDGAADPTYTLDDYFERRLTTGLIYTPDANGNYTSNPIQVDLTAIYAGGHINELPDLGAGDNAFKTNRGRTDYYRMSGNVASAEGGYLYLCPSWSTHAMRVKIANGAYVSHEHYNVAQYTDWSGNVTTLDIDGSSENYVFPIDGRDDVIAQLRSQVTAQVLNEHFAGTTEENALAVQRMTSRVNTAGGTTIAFNNDLFMISPQARYSRNLGDFIVMRANKTDVSDINTADLHWTIPVWQVEQDEISSSEKTNANGNWYFAEESTWTVDNQEVPCVYIYQYIPGIRFAKYRLYPLTQFPNPEAQFDIVTGYQCDDNGTPIDITCFDGHVTWQKPAGYNYIEGQSTYRLDSYHLDILDAAGTVIDHTIVAHNDNQLVFAYDYAGTELLDDKTNYTARIYATYTDINGKEYISDRYNALDNHEYIPAPPVVENVNAYIHSGLWDNDVYRVELNFDRPTETTEPVSYYSVYAKMPTGETVQITDFNLMVDGVENENIVDGVALLWDSIPGTYDFDANEAAWHAGLPEASPNKSTLVWYHTVEMGHYTHSSSMARATANDPSTWTYYVVANYASSNAKLVAAEEASKTTDSDLIITGVEAVSAEVTGMLKVFPNPAHSVVNIQSVVAIETVALYNEAGAEVLNAAGNGENAMQLDVESLADGVYFLRVNNLPPVKIVKN